MKGSAFSVAVEVAVVVFALCCGVCVAANPSGTCGALQWEFDTASGTLTISGDGEMCDNYPWGGYFTRIKKVVFSGNVKSIGTYAFYMTQLTEMSLIMQSWKNRR